MKLIDADEIIERCNFVIEHGIASADGSHPISAEVVLEVLKETPTIDAIPVVRCKDCIHRFFCRDLLNKEPDDYCSDGERRGF